MRRVLIRLTLLLGVVLLALLFLWTFVLRIYRVDSGSMEPFLFGSAVSGESVLVLFDRSVPERYEPVILRMREGAVVKRAVGLPGESVEIRYGDLVIDTKKLGPEVTRPPFPVVFDQEHHALEDHFILGAREDLPWHDTSEAKDAEAREGGATWELDALSIDPKSTEGELILHRNVSDDYTDSSHRIVLGARTVNDLAADAQVRFLEFAEKAELRITLREWGDDFVLVVEPGAKGSTPSEPRGRMLLFRESEGEDPKLMARETVHVPLDTWSRVRFENIDDHLTARFEAQGSAPVLLHTSYEVGRFAEGDAQRKGKTMPPRVRIGGARLRLQLRGLRVERDLFYTPRDRYGVTEDVQLGVDQIFVLGDNSAKSRDSRQFGPVSMDEVVGRPIRVVWPPSAWRSLTD